jgi:anti-sigma factor RsiW
MRDMNNVTKVKLAWRYRRVLWKYRRVLRHRRAIGGIALAAGAVVVGWWLMRGTTPGVAASNG